MRTRTEQAAAIIYGYLECLPSCDTADKDEQGRCKDCYHEALDTAYELRHAGLLALDAPEPRIDLAGWQEWGHKHGSHVTLEDGVITVVIPDDISRDLTCEEAQELATWLNAAANEAKRGRR
nr:MAG TPA_asm: hypothetical protein [Caudoviricetes sp.]